MASSSWASSTTSSVALPTAKGTPQDCQTSYEGSFPIAFVDDGSAGQRKRGEGLIISLTDSVIKDAENRIGYFASNEQFQFAPSVPSDALYAAGWAVCSGGKIYLGSESSFKECQSNLYINAHNGSSCLEVSIMAVDPGANPNSTLTTTIFSTSTLHIAYDATSSPSSPTTVGQASGSSTGSSVGIGFGVVLGAIFLAGIVWFFLRRRRAGRRGMPVTKSEKAELLGKTEVIPELASTKIYEAASVGRLPEVGDTVRVELESDWRGWEMQTQPER